MDQTDVGLTTYAEYLQRQQVRQLNAYIESLLVWLYGGGKLTSEAEKLMTYSLSTVEGEGVLQAWDKIQAPDGQDYTAVITLGKSLTNKDLREALRSDLIARLKMHLNILDDSQNEVRQNLVHIISDPRKGVEKLVPSAIDFLKKFRTLCETNMKSKGRTDRPEHSRGWEEAQSLPNALQVFSIAIIQRIDSSSLIHISWDCAYVSDMPGSGGYEYLIYTKTSEAIQLRLKLCRRLLVTTIHELNDSQGCSSYLKLFMRVFGMRFLDTECPDPDTADIYKFQDCFTDEMDVPNIKIARFQRQAVPVLREKLRKTESEILIELAS